MNKRVCVLAALLVGVAAGLRAQNACFNVADGIWEAPGNWSPAYVPGLTNNVKVTFTGRIVRITQPGAICTNMIVGDGASELGFVYLSTGTLYTATLQNIGKYGRGTFVQSPGTTNRFGGSYLVLGEQTSGYGRYELQGGYLGPNGSVTEMNVAYSGTGVFYQAGGTLDEISADKYLYIGRTAAANGTYVMNGGEILFTNKTYVAVGWNGAGTFIQSNGTVNVAKVFNVGKEAGGRGTYRLTGGKISSGQFTMGEKATGIGAASVEGGEFTTTAEGWDVGYSGTGTVWQSGGVVTLNKYLFIARAPGSKGTYVMTGGDLALTNANNHVYVGEEGNGTLIQSNGSFRVLNWLTISRKTGSTGYYRMVGGSLSVGGQLQMSEQVNTSARFEIVGTNSVIGCSSFAMTTNSVVRFEIATNGVSKIAVQNTATLSGKLEVVVPQKLFNQPVTILSMGSRSGTFNSVVPVYPLRAVDISYPSGSGNVVLSNFRYYTGTLITVF